MSTGVASECQTVEPMRAPLTLSTLDPETPQQFTEVLNVLRSVVGQNLFLWETFPIHLPESISNAFDNSVGSIFNAPDFDECEILSKDGRGNLKPLNRYQLAQLRQSGEFDVESANFIGEAHTWRISSFFLKGTRHIRQTFLKDLDAALSWLVITAHDRVVGHQFSVKNGISALYTHFFRMLVDLFFGWPYVNHGDVDRKLMEERLRFITCELSVKSSQRKRVMDFWDFYEQLMCCPRDTPVEQLNLKYSPYRFVTPSRIPIDLRLHNSALLDRCLAVIHDLRQSTRAGWFQDFKERSISRFRGEGKSIADIKRLVRNDGLREYAKRLFEAMRQNITLQSVGHGIVEPLIQQASFSIILAEAKEEFMLAWLAYREDAEKELRKQHCILYRIEEWRFRRMARIQRDYFEAHMFDVHEYVLAKCTEANLEQHAFFISRDLVFLKEREKLLRDQLEKSASFPDTQFIFQVPAQLLRHWRVYRKNISYTTSYDLVDTILLSRRPSSKDQVPLIKRSIKKVVGHENPYAVVQTAYQQRRPPTTEQELGPQDFEVHAAASPKCIYDGSSTPCVGNQDVEDTNKGAEPVFGCDVTPTVRRAQPEYVVQSKLVYKASTRYFLWRWLVFFVCTYTWLLRTGQLFFIIIPFRSAFSLTALFKPTPIYLKLDLDQSTGYLFYNRTFYQDTLISRLCRIWRNIRASRIAFDATPSKGLLDKAAARPLHRVWSYVFRGFLTSLILILVWPPLCLIVSFTSLLLGLCIPFVIPLVSLILHFLGILFWDAYKPATRSNRLFPLFEVIINHFLLRFLFQTIFAFLTGFFVCPILAVLHVFWAIVRCVSRSIWDALIFHLVLRRLARVPAREDFMVKRIAGPGTAANSFYEAHPVDVLIILICQLELLELRLWRRQMEALADKPIELYQRLIKGLSWLSVTPQIDGNVYTSLCRHTKSWHSSIQYTADEYLNLKANQLHRIKLSDRDLRLTLRMGSELTEYFYQHRISPRLAELKLVPLNWWSTFGLGVDDFLGLCTNLLGKTFGEQFFTCIMETDTVFPLQVNEPSIGRHFEEFLGRMVRKRPMVENRSLPSLTPSRDRVEREPQVQINDDELLSLASDAIASSADIISQRCTVIAASSKRDPERRIPSVEQHSGLIEMGSVGKLDITDRETAVTFALPADLRGTQQRSVPDPIAFIHIDLPLFPLSAFTPSSNRYLPLPLN
ncbi:unnamed protein product [Calicophoron daubneyi]|uniref:Uncharacterized protein n=1 Tax=Calicophoron daubneyi TaxID=300641 RepID=A0AAV2T9K3_CALDB